MRDIAQNMNKNRAYTIIFDVWAFFLLILGRNSTYPIIYAEEYIS